ncbi:MAG: AMP-binding protein [Candidatus Accumulibacter sp.]|jgi:phenylacetate-CoA ligase|nr:AMP-binding protein [Accumulibacter sp.]
MGFRTALLAGFLFPLQERLKGHDTVAIRRRLDDSQWWPAERLEQYRTNRLRELLVRAGKHVPYFRDCFSAMAFDPRSVSSTGDLRALPFLTKSIIRREGERMKSEVAGKLSRFNTGGSSGEPLVFYVGNERISHDVAAKWRATRWWGVDVGDPEIVVWGSPIELSAQDRLRGARDWLMRTELLPAFEMSEARLDAFVERIRARRPAMLFGYPSAIGLIAAHAAKRKIALDGLGIKVVFVTSERLYEHQRRSIGEAFGCPVANGYGSRDAGFIAHECPAGKIHLSAEDIIVEIVDAQGKPPPPGVPGEIAVTHLATADFPFIRYRTGDVAALGTERCACGRTLPVLEDIQGRSTDFVVAADGTVMHGLALIYVLRDMPGIGQFKVVQESLDFTRVMVVAEAGFSAETERGIIAGLRERLGAAVRVEVQPMDRIPAEKSGKFRYVVSRVQRTEV